MIALCEVSYTNVSTLTVVLGSVIRYLCTERCWTPQEIGSPSRMSLPPKTEWCWTPQEIGLPSRIPHEPTTETEWCWTPQEIGSPSRIPHEPTTEN